LRDRALLLIQFFGAFRVSELVKIEYEHLAWLAEGVEILIPKSKTDQIQQGQRVFIPHSDNALCPVTALKEWLALSKISSGFIFKSLTKNQQVKHAKETPLPTRNVHTLIKQIAKACGLSFEGKSYSTHSLRSGLATTASRNNASIKSIMRQGRWRNINTVLGYIEDGQRIDDNAAQHILSRTPSFQNT
jgi:Site-specific recombinase XerD